MSKVTGCIADALTIIDILRISWVLGVNRYSYFLTPSYNGPLLFCGRAILTLHDLMHINFSEYVTLKNWIYYRFVVLRCIKAAPIVFTVSQFSRREIVEWAGISEDKVIVLDLGVSELFSPTVEPRTEVRPYVLYVGDKKVHKNLKRLLLAYKNSTVSHDFDLILSGKPSVEIQQMISDLHISHSVRFCGFIAEEDMPSLYKGARALLFPSLYEGFGLPIIEAMAVGTPVLTSNVASMPEVSGGAALMVDPYSVEEITAGIDRICRDEQLRTTLIRDGLTNARRFNWENTRNQWDAAVSQYLGEI